MKSNPLVIAPGTLRCQIQVQAQSGQDSLGGSAGTWATLLTCMAAISTMSSREVFQASQFADQATHLITTYWPGSLGIQAGMRVLYDGREFTIQMPPENVQERNRVLKLTCLEINNAPVQA